MSRIIRNNRLTHVRPLQFIWRASLLPQIAAARHILVVTKFRFLGDTIVATPFLKKLHETCPQAKIDVLAGPAVQLLLENLPFVSEVITFGPGQTRSMRDNLIMRKRLHLRGYNCAFVLNRSLHSAALIRGAHIPFRVGFNTEHRGPFLNLRVPYDKYQSERECLQSVLSASGIGRAQDLPTLIISETEKVEARNLLNSYGHNGTKQIVVIHPGANEPYVRQWGAERFAKTADELSAHHNCQIIVMGSADESDETAKVVNLMHSKPIVLTGTASLRQAMGVLSIAELWIGNDGGMLHAAVALGASTIGMFGPTKAHRWGYNEPRHKTMVTNPTETTASAARIRQCLDAISVESVLKEAIPLLSTKL